jgi:hypothetical protein
MHRQPAAFERLEPIVADSMNGSHRSDPPVPKAAG